MTWHRNEPENAPDDAVARPAQSLRLRCILHSMVPAQTVSVRVTGEAGEVRTFSVSVASGETSFSSDPFPVAGNKVQVVFAGAGTTVQASASDSRQLSYLVAAASLEPVRN